MEKQVCFYLKGGFIVSKGKWLGVIGSVVLVFGLTGCFTGVINSTGTKKEITFLTPFQITKSDFEPANTAAAKKYLKKNGHVAKATKYEINTNKFKGTILLPNKFKAPNGKSYTYKLKDTKTGLVMTESSGGSRWILQIPKGKASEASIINTAKNIVREKTDADSVKVEKIDSRQQFKFYPDENVSLYADIIPIGAKKNSDASYRLTVYRHSSEDVIVITEANQNELVRDEFQDGASPGVVWHYLSEIGERAAATALPN
jgi:hypothetical protein